MPSLRGMPSSGGDRSEPRPPALLLSGALPSMNTRRLGSPACPGPVRVDPAGMTNQPAGTRTGRAALWQRDRPLPDPHGAAVASSTPGSPSDNRLPGSPRNRRRDIAGPIDSAVPAISPPRRCSVNRPAIDIRTRLVARTQAQQSTTRTVNPRYDWPRHRAERMKYAQYRKHSTRSHRVQNKCRILLEIQRRRLRCCRNSTSALSKGMLVSRAR
jgi:hypothetical protein